MTGGALMVTAPVRDAWTERWGPRPRWAEFWPVVGSLTLTAALVLFFLQYLSPFRAAIVAQPVTTAFRSLNETAEVRTIGSVLVSTAVLVGVLLFILRRWKPPLGTFTVLFGVPALAMSGLDSFERLPLAFCAVVGGLVADILIEADIPVRWIATAVPAAVWLPYFIEFKIAYDLPWTIHLWLGTVLLAGLTGLALSLLSDPPRTDQQLGTPD
jgi:hypothetical protein